MIGCGPIGLAVILMLKAAGVRTVVASDLSPGRRDLAQRCGADVVVDPAVAVAVGRPTAGPATHLTSAPDYFGQGIDAMRMLRRVRRRAVEARDAAGRARRPDAHAARSCSSASACPA